MDRKRNHCSLSLKQKLEIIKAVADNKHSKNKLAKLYKCNISTINRIIKNQESYKKVAQNGNLQRKRQRKGIHGKLEDALYTWFQQNKNDNDPRLITNAELLKKAKELALLLEDDFEPCCNWLFRWRKRHGIDVANCKSVIDSKEESKKQSSSNSDIGASENNSDSSLLTTTCKKECVNFVESMSSCEENSTTQDFRHEFENAAPFSISQIARNNDTVVSENRQDNYAPSINEALQALLVVKRYCILNDMEIGTLFNIEEKILQHWKIRRSK
uniref:Tigger transposable element-derived protein 3 n=1 Tax=Ceratitis capitata TaxID=7213 RepID=W8C8R8_CERCA